MRGSTLAGLYYPMIVAGLTFVVGSIFLKETHGTLIWSEVETDRPGAIVSDIEGRCR